jgi:hypothetical protein
MNAKGHTANSDAPVLHWPGRVLSLADLQRSLNGHRDIILAPGTIITPLAAEELRHRGVTLTRRTEKPAASSAVTWGVACERSYAVVTNAMQGLARESTPLRELAWHGARAVADQVATGTCVVAFCEDPALVCCVANKLPGLRAAAVNTVLQASRAATTLGANLLAVEMPGRTFFEVRQILRNLGRPVCPEEMATVLRGLDGHAHR